MGRFLIRVVVNGFALWVGTWLLPGLTLSTGATKGLIPGAVPPAPADALGTVLAYLFIGLIFAAVNAWVRPVVKVLSIPVTILTLGLFTLVINGGMLYLTSWISGFTPVHLGIDSFFWTAILAALIVSIVSMLAEPLVRQDRDER
ncbi:MULTISPECIES: phage holin family protein [Arthrobacter]|uniref:Phage holin family protein n=2 Tax=Arthrobacter TaxID=1663 RepID=A0ABU9KJD1_9MICC|nr:phage holin family protein [Arthrobacter sp. YJM1]MDP5226818.1 phage holin family protein [Arthrobacter sp. YJM1]